MLSVGDVFNCVRCREWYVRNFDAGPEGKCRHCYWNIPVKREAIVPEEVIAELMARELEALLSDT